MDNVFSFRDKLIVEYMEFSQSFVKISAKDIKAVVEEQYADGRYWPEPLIQINPNYQRKGTVQELADSGVLHFACRDLFKIGKGEGKPQPLYLYSHQMQSLAKAQNGQSYVVTTGTGSGKSLSFFIPMIDRILKGKDTGKAPRTRAIVIYPMNALANSQLEELGKFLEGYADGEQPFTVARYTGQESALQREEIAQNPPDILLTNFMMLELILTRYEGVDRRVVENCKGLEFLVLDELHTYRGRQGADVAVLVRRLRARLDAENMTCIGTSATMSSTGTQVDRNKVVAEVASKLFGALITEHDVIGETLERVTNPEKDVEAVKPFLKECINKSTYAWNSFDQFKEDPLAIWVELNLGIELSDDEPPRRAKPKTLREASILLANDAGCDESEASGSLQRFLVAAHEIKTPQGRAPFAFKLHQFISGPGKVLATLEAENIRHVTLDAQRYAPGRQADEVQLYPVHFCRDCGQEYYPVWKSERGLEQFSPREIDDITTEDNEEQGFGFLCPRSDKHSYQGNMEDLPENWIDFSKAEPKIKSNYKKSVPQPYDIEPKGFCGNGESYWYIPGKFRFCLCCGQLHEAHGKDINRLASLSGEGRSSATTMIALSALMQLFSATVQEGIPDPRKLLGFTDNRQDAALQAGHFNDFIFLLMLRSGLIGALQQNQNTLNEERLTEEVFKALGFDKVDEATLSEYLRTPKMMGLARQEAQRTLRYIIGYRLIRDLRKGWRFNNPNLDQLNLLSLNYRHLADFCNDQSAFDSAKNSVLSSMSPANREKLCCLLFDEMRRSLCLETRYLDPVEQDKARTSGYTNLNERWAFAHDEILETSRHLVLGRRPEYRGKPRNDLVSSGPRSRILRKIKMDELWRNTAFAGQISSWKDPEWVEIIQALLQSATYYGYIQKHSIDKELVGYRLNASALEWSLVTENNTISSRVNQFFRQLYLNVAKLLKKENHPVFGFEAQEHTAQVDPARRQLLEQRFRYTDKDRREWADNPAHEAPLERLPVMFCSPTMELGVDISALNTVYLRNVPPTPANYAQRSGRAGRSGQQALVITYCASLSPHDQWFFNNANEMVHGVVKAPTLDLGNNELIKSHLQAVWLASAEIALDNSIAPMLDLEHTDKPVKVEIMNRLNEANVLERAKIAARRVIAQLESDISTTHWYYPGYVEDVIERAPKEFSNALERWRALFDATKTQMAMADRIVKSHTATHNERQNAQRRYGDAARQYAILLKTGNTQNSDFYTYRYLASQGFLPGYNFPRLPLMAWIPARGGQNATGNDDEGSMVSRPRFLALSEFGPRSLIYHQGRMYRVVRAKLNVGSADHISGNSQLATISSRICSQCGFGHLGEIGGEELLVERCENCDALLTEDEWVRELYRIETVETVATERISINDEERQRQGFELQTTYRYLPGPDGRIQKQQGMVVSGDEPIAELTYAPAARIWRINRGWRRRKDKNQLGFYINPITGTWSKQDDPNASDDNGGDSALLEKVPNQRIVPYVEDHRNILILAAGELPIEVMATLQAALKRGIEMSFQIEESELVAEPLPKSDDRKALLFYEASEGGAGVLTRLASEPESLALVAGKALELMHFSKPQGSWRFEELDQLEKRDDQGNRICEAGCYQCLLSYFNQPDHEHINRRNSDVIKLLVALANAQVTPANSIKSEGIPAEQVSDDSDSLAKQWLLALGSRGLRMPDATQLSISNGQAVATAQYKTSRTLVFVETIPVEVSQQLLDKGWTVLDFSNTHNWNELFDRHAALLGRVE